jgi:hypothetical protein
VKQYANEMSDGGGSEGGGGVRRSGQGGGRPPGGGKVDGEGRLSSERVGSGGVGGEQSRSSGSSWGGSSEESAVGREARGGQVKTERDVVNLAMEMKARNFAFLPAQRLEIEKLEEVVQEMAKKADHIASLRQDLRRGYRSRGDTDMGKCGRMLMVAEARLVPLKESMRVAARSVAVWLLPLAGMRNRLSHQTRPDLEAKMKIKYQMRLDHEAKDNLLASQDGSGAKIKGGGGGGEDEMGRGGLVVVKKKGVFKSYRKLESRQMCSKVSSVERDLMCQKRPKVVPNEVSE